MSDADPQPAGRLYLTAVQVNDLFEHLRSHLRIVQCDHSLSQTLSWAEASGVTPAQFQRALARHKAHCDCQVVLRVLRMTPPLSVPYGVIL